jgi:hypothetical protein
VVPSLLGVAEAPAPLWRHILAAVRDALSQVADSVLLIGHSGAGLLLPVIADATTSKVGALIFVDAFLPPQHGSTPLMPPALMDRLHPLAGEGALPPWSRWFGEDTMRELVPDETVRRSLEQEMPRLPLAYFQARVPMPDGWAQRPCAYLLLSPDTYCDSAARASASGWPVQEIPGAHHLSIITDPLAVADRLLDVERQLFAE